MDKLKILFLVDHNNPVQAGTIRDHINAIRYQSRHDVTVMNPRYGASFVGVDLARFDVILIHYSIWIIWESYLSTKLAEKIRRAPCLKAQIIQDEYRYINATVDKMVELGIDVLFSCVPPESLPKIYADPRMASVRKEFVLTGYVPENFTDDLVLPPIAERPVDIGYRSRHNASWLGNLAREKVLIAEGVLARAPGLELRCDVSTRESDRFYGKEWPAFLANCRAVLGTGSGASIADFAGDVESAANDYLIRNPWASYDEIFRNVLAPYEGNVVINTISPRVFEAAVTRTAQIMFESPYAGVVEPSVHYIPLKRDFSNMAEVANLVRDDRYLRELTDSTHADLVASGKYAYAKFAGFVDDVLAEEVSRRHETTGKPMTEVRARSERFGPSKIATFFYMRIYMGLFSPITALATYKRFVTVLLLCVTDHSVMAFIVTLLAADRGVTARLWDVLPDLGRLAVLRRGRVRGHASRRRLALRTVLNDDILFILGAGSDESGVTGTSAGGKAPDNVSNCLAEGRIKRILWQARLPVKDRPRFLEGASPIHSVYEFEYLARLGQEFPRSIGRLLPIGPFSIEPDGPDGGQGREDLSAGATP